MDVSRRVATVLLLATAVVVALLAAAPAPAGANYANPADAAFDVYAHHPLWQGAGAPKPPPALVRYYGVKLNPAKAFRRYTRSSRYFPGGAKFRLASDEFPNTVLDGSASRRFVGWDLLRLPYYGLNAYDWAEVSLHRDARLCLALGDRVEPEVRVAGYERAGVGVLAAADAVEIDGGPPALKVGLFCKDVAAGLVRLPRATLLNVQADFGYDVLLAEAGGVTPTRPPPPPGVGAVWPNAQCPDRLHDAWRTGDHDPADADTKGKTWRTWHPQIDPIYWCYYGHDHGTAPHFQSVPPRLGYTAWKNGRQLETHVGFKGYGLRSGNDNYYITVHASTSEMRRIRERFHTTTLAASSATTGEVFADLSCKGDFGFTFALAANFRQSPTTILTVGGVSQARLYNQVAQTPFEDRPKNAKRVNVWSGGPNTDRTVDLTDLPRGRYEVWDGGINFCTRSAHHRGMTVDIKVRVRSVSVGAAGWGWLCLAVARQLCRGWCCVGASAVPDCRAMVDRPGTRSESDFPSAPRVALLLSASRTVVVASSLCLPLPLWSWKMGMDLVHCRTP